MPRILVLPDNTTDTRRWSESWPASTRLINAFREIIHCTPGAKDIAGRNKPLAQGKPAGSGSKGHPPRRGRKAGKVLGKKRSRKPAKSGA